MFKYLIKSTLRNFRKNSVYTAINLFCLLIGITAFLLLFVYVDGETGYDAFYPDHERIYRIQMRTQTGDSTLLEAITPTPLAPEIPPNFAEVESSTRVCTVDLCVIQQDEKILYEKNLVFADDDFFNIFPRESLEGSLKDFESNPKAAVITKTTAIKYFGRTDVSGEIFKYNNQVELYVSAVVPDVPKKSHFHYDFVLPFEVYEKTSSIPVDQWTGYTTVYTYVKLRENSSAASLSSGIAKFLNKYRTERSDYRMNLYLQPLSSIHLDSHTISEMEKNNSRQNIFLVVSIALLILIIAGVNFINLNTALVSKRLKEVGIRKYIGATGMDIMKLVLAEAVIVAYIATLFALLVIAAFSQPLGMIFGTGDSIILPFDNIIFILTLILFPAVAAVVFSYYPASYLAKQKAVKHLKSTGSSLNGAKPGFIRKGLIIFQFVSSVVLLITAFIIHSQLNYIHEKELGFDFRNDLIVELPNIDNGEELGAIKEELLRHPGIDSVTACIGAPISNSFAEVSVFPNGRQGKRLTFHVKPVDLDYINHYGIKIITGRAISRKYNDDEHSFVLNEAAARALGYTNYSDLLGKELETGLGGLKGRIVGIAKDFNIKSLHSEIEPLFMLNFPRFNGQLALKVNTNNYSEVSSYIENVWGKFYPAFPLKADFLEDKIAALYKADEKSGKIIGIFSSVAILISCLGLLGLALFSAQTRTKEVAVRKVLGATTSNLLIFMNRQFARWVLLANLIGWPLAYFVVNEWLKNFAYRAPVNPVIFIVSGLIIFALSTAAVTSQALKVAMTKPVISLRYE